MSLGEISNKTVRKTITENIFKQELGHDSYLLKDKQVCIVATTEIEGAHVLPRDTTTISDELQQGLHGVGCRDVAKPITPDSALRYARRVIARVNKEEDNAGGQKRNTITGIIKVLGLIHKRANQCDPRLAWDTFHNIYHMYSNIKKMRK